MFSMRKGLLVVVIANSGNFAGYLFQLLAAHKMSPPDYGIFNALNSLIVLLSSPLPVLNLFVAKLIIKALEIDGAVKFLWKTLLKYSGVLSLTALCIGSLFIPLIVGYFHLSRKFYAFLAVLQISLVFILPSLSGTLQGLGYYVALATLMALFHWGRLATGAGFSVHGLTITEALLSGIVGAVAAIIWGLFISSKALPPAKNVSFRFFDLVKKESFGSLPFLALNYFIVSLFLNIDLMLVRHYLPPEEVGFYAAAAILGRISFYLVGILGAVVFAETVRHQGARSTLKLILLACIVSFGYSIVCGIWPEGIIKLLLGAKYVHSAPILRILALGMSFLSLASLFFARLLGEERYGFLWGALFCILLTTGAVVFKWHRSGTEIAFWVLIGTFFSFLWVVWFWLRGGAKCFLS